MHYLIVSIPEENIQHLPHAHEHVVHALHGHARALGKRAQHLDVFPVLQYPGSAQLEIGADGSGFRMIEVKPGEAVNLQAPAGHRLRIHEYHSDGMTIHHLEISVQTNEDFEAENGVPALPQAYPAWRPHEVPDRILDAWPQHEPIDTTPATEEGATS